MQPVEKSLLFAVQQKGSMDDVLLNDYIERLVMPLYANLAKEVMFGDGGKLCSGLVILKLDASPGQIVANVRR